jgi:hypothetical protein
MRTVIVAVTAAVSLALAGAAAGGGFATVQMSAYPGDAKPGEPWDVDLTVLQHGVRPLAGLRPIFRIRNVRTGEERSFVARPTAGRGVYRASVVFPSAGRWDYEISDGFGATHTYAPVAIGEGAPAAVPRVGGQTDDGAATAGIALGTFALVVALMSTFALARRQRRRPAAA